MNRLTTRNRNKTVGIGEPLRPYNYQDIQRVLERLADYEDTGLEPQEIKDILELFYSYRHICGETPPDRLRELVESDREGRCVVLPKVDDSSKQSFSDGLEDVFKEWSYEDKSAGLFGMSEGEKELANALMVVLKGEQHEISES